MTTWRMSMRAGNQGPEMWPQCRRLGIAAITYAPMFLDVDLSRYPQFQPADLWAQLAPAQHASLGRVAYEMKKGDVIYVKQGPRIVGRGVVKGSYKFDYKHRLVDPHGHPWSHQVPVDWESDFPSVDILLGAEPLTVLELSGEKLRRLEAAIVGTAKPIGRQTKVHLAVSATQIGKHKTLREDFIPNAQKGRIDDWTATKKFSPGDLVLFYFGKPVKSIWGIGVVASEIRKEKGRFYWTSKPTATFCDFEPVWLLENPVSLERATRLAGLQDWYNGSPYRGSRELDPDIAQALLHQIARTNPNVTDLLQAYKVRVRKPKGATPTPFHEGGVQEVTLELRKRDPRLRAQAIAEYGCKCQICGFDFEEAYGELGAGYIEVHHLRPLSGREKEHVVMVKDAAVVCANCHRVLHRKGKTPIPISKLRKVVEQRRYKNRK